MKKHFAILTACILSISLLLTSCTKNNNDGNISPEIANGETTATPTITTLDYIDEINKNEIMTFEITVDAAAWQGMLDNAAAEEYISADITINGTTIKNVGIRPKGNSSLSSVTRDETTDRYSFKIKFDEYVTDQTWLGLDKIVLNSNFSDATSMKEYLSYDIMNYIGVATPLYSFADISVNGEILGFYLAIEDLDSGYIDRVYNGEGELYKPEGMEMGGDIANDMNRNANEQSAPPTNSSATSMPPDSNNSTQTSVFPGGQNGGFGGMKGASNGVSLVYTDDAVESYSAIFDNAETKTDTADNERVIAALKNLNQGIELETYVDVQAVLKYFAAHTVVVNLDSYVSNMGHNYYLYENNGQLTILPWDYNLAFGGFQSGSASDVVNFPIDTPVSGVSMEERPILSKLLEVPEYLENYHEYLQEILNGYFNDGKFEQKVEQLNTLISEHIKNDPTAFYTYEEYQSGITELKKLATLRAESIQGQLNGTIPATTDGQKADTSALIDASSVNMEALGTQGGGGMGGDMGGMNGGGGMGGMNLPDGLTMENMQSAMNIINQATNGELTDEQRSQLYELGLTDEAIEQMLQMPQRGQMRPN